MYDEKLALTCALLSQEIYTKFRATNFDSLPSAETMFFESEDKGETDTQVAALLEPETQTLFIVFRGSEKSIDWINNFQFRQQVYPYGDESLTDVRFHRGFMSAYLAVREDVHKQVREYPHLNLIVTGHSLGGALATIAALDLQYNITEKTGQSLQVYTYGAPRVGNSALVNSFRQRVPHCYRLIYGWDIVTRVPRSWQGYEHVPEAFQLGNRWTWNFVTRRFSDHAIGNYVAALEPKV